MLDHILVKEGLHMENMGRVVPDGPNALEMKR